MIVVCDTTPISYLIQIELIDLLPRLYGDAFIPSTVLEELLHPKAPIPVRNWAASLPSWVVVQPPVPIDPQLSSLHRGEQQAIALAESLHAHLLLTDDFKARTIAHQRGIDTVTTLLILDTAADRKWISFPTAIAALLQTNFRVDNFTIQQLLAKHA